MKIDWVFFDAGNTLLGLNYRTLLDALAGEGFRVTEMALRRAEMSARRDLDRAILKRWSEGSVPLRGWVEEKVWLGFWRDVLALCGAGPGDVESLVGTVLNVTRPASSWDRVDSSTMPTLETLASRGYRLGIISNSNGTLAHQMRRLGMAKRFEMIIDSSEVGVEKPHPEIFRMTLERAGGVAADRALYVGDVYAIDVLEAAGAGMHAMLFDPLGQHDPATLPRGAPACRTLGSLAELTGLLG
ncbi:MAG TPA: HAD family hydrolase [Candidatus Polarisedimenticolia bacterium]